MLTGSRTFRVPSLSRRSPYASRKKERVKKQNFFSHALCRTYVYPFSAGNYFLSLPLFLRRKSEAADSYFLVKHESLRRTSEAADSYFLVKYEFLRRTPAADSYFLVKHEFLRRTSRRRTATSW